ncbi:MAG: hypothetical protein JWQ40_5085 [Segetibacter sp.]|nr:hypothetical protein [Segetibacter sp.]
MASLNFPPQLKNGSLVIRLSYQTTTADRKFLNTGFKVPGTKIKGVYKFWDAKKQRVKPGAEKCEEINDYLQFQENNFLDYLKECKARQKQPNINELTQLFKDGRGRAKANETLKPVLLDGAKIVQKGKGNLINLGPIGDLSPMMKLFLKFAVDKNSDVKKDSFKHYKTFAIQLQEFEKQRENGLVNVNAVDVKFYKEFTFWLISKHNNVNSTLNRKVTRLKTFLNWCMEEGYINIGTFKKAYKLSEVDASKFPLYKSEKDLLYKYIPKAGTESLVYWAFRFALCTGLRYSDVVGVMPANIKYLEDNGEKLYYLDIVEQKTQERTAVPLSKMALDILAKAKANSKGQLFNVPTDQECNRTLKEIGGAIKLDRICEVKQLQGKEMITEYLPLKEILSFHFARYTYITELLNSGLAPIHVQNNVGHNKLETTLDYNRDIQKDRLKETLLIQEKIA